MSEIEPSRYYRISLPPSVFESLEEIEERADNAGRYDAFAASLDRLREILCTFPQLGEPLTDVEVEGKSYTTRIVTTPALAALYVIDEENRRVVIYEPLKVMPNAGFK